MSSTLFVVATPIGNLEDITIRALRVLREVSVIAAEDTRRTAHLLARHAISTPTTSLHEHNEAGKSGALIARLQQLRLLRITEWRYRDDDPPALPSLQPMQHLTQLEFGGTNVTGIIHVVKANATPHDKRRNA